MESDPFDADEDAAFLSSLPADPFTGPRRQSRVFVRQPPNVETLILWLTTLRVPWIFRGQEKFRWRLSPRLAREFDALPPPAGEGASWDWIGLENRVISFFKERARRVLVTPPDDLDLVGWLALMQHYGAPTRLLDWTSSPFVALWFAYEAQREEPSALWALNAYLCRRGPSGSVFPGGWDHLGILQHSTTDAEGNTVTRVPALEVRQRDRENEFLRWSIRRKSRWPYPLIPFEPDARMAAQQTVLTAVGNLDEPVDAALLRFHEWQHETPLGGDDPPPGGVRIGTDSTVWRLQEPADLLLKIALPNEWRADVLAILATMGIDASTLFPGLDGVGRETAQYLQGGQGSLRDVITDTFSA